jgi:hypothetical protein
MALGLDTGAHHRPAAPAAWGRLHCLWDGSYRLDKHYASLRNSWRPRRLRRQSGKVGPLWRHANRKTDRRIDLLPRGAGRCLMRARGGFPRFPSGGLGTHDHLSFWRRLAIRYLTRAISTMSLASWAGSRGALAMARHLFPFS